MKRISVPRFASILAATAMLAIAAALSACNGEARAATQRDANITSDILATRPNNWSNTASGPIGTQNQYFSGGQGQLFENQERDLSASIVNQCMIGKGYAPGS